MADTNIEEIERNLERDRQALAVSVAALAERLRPSTMVARTKARMLREAGPIMSSVDQTIRTRPVATAAAGLAIMALVAGRQRAASSEGASDQSTLAGSRYEALTRWEDEGVRPRIIRPIRKRTGWRRRGDYDRANRLLGLVDRAVRRGLAPSDGARHRAEIVSAFGRDSAAALGSGLGSLSETARQQALKAREAIYIARVSASRHGRDLIDDNPLPVGAVAAAVGAGVACLFPPTEAEDRLMGEARDELLDDLRQTLKTEVLRASDFASTLQNALKSDVERASVALRRSEAPPVVTSVDPG